MSGPIHFGRAVAARHGRDARAWRVALTDPWTVLEQVVVRQRFETRRAAQKVADRVNRARLAARERAT